MTTADSLPHGIGVVCMLAATGCIFACGYCWIAALRTKPPELSLFDSQLWFKLPPAGKRLRNKGMLFWIVAAALGGAGWLAFHS
jgi:hypothetical protein